MNQLVVCTWATVNEGCPISCSVSGSNLAHLMIGDNQLELNLDAASLRELATRSTAALAEMDAQFEQEEAERSAQEAHLSAELSA
jgi:hypothetical protein